jgi:putative flippase GtrA
MGLKTLLRFIIFCFVGGIATLIDFIIFNLFYFIGIGFVISRFFGIVISMVWNFGMNRNVTFNARNGKYIKQLSKYLVVYAVSMGANVLVGVIILSLLGDGTINANIAAAAGLSLSIPLSFFGSWLWTFRKEKPGL